MSRIVLLDLAGDSTGARTWARQAFPGARVVELEKNELKYGSKRSVAARLRADGGCDAFLVYCNDLHLQPSLGLMMLFGLLSGARGVVVADRSARSVARRARGILLAEVPRLIAEALVGYALVVPLAWAATLAVSCAGRLRTTELPGEGAESLQVLYVDGDPLSGSRIGANTTLVAATTRALARLGHRVRFVAHDRLPLVDHRRMPLTTIAPSGRLAPTRSVFEIWNGLRFALGTLGAARSARPNVIYQRHQRFNLAGALVSAACRRPFLLEFNSSETWKANHWDPVGQRHLLAAIERANLRLAHRVVVVSGALRRECERAGVDPLRIIVNPNGVECDLFYPGAGGERVRHELGLGRRLVVGFSGTFGPWHGVAILPAVLAAIPREFDAVFLMIGDGDLRACVEHEIERSGLRDRSVFTGRLPNEHVPAYLDACDVLLSPHTLMPDGSETFYSPIKIFEYMAAGKAIVASRVGQIADVLEDGRTGLLVAPGSAAAAAEAVVRLATDPELRRRLGDEARKIALSRHSWDRNAERLAASVGR